MFLNWECPDIFSLDGRDILMTGTMGEVHTICRIGDYDHEAGTFRETAWQSMEQGFDFYAGQTVQTPDGRRILIGWMQNPATAENRDIDFPINSQMSIICRLSPIFSASPSIVSRISFRWFNVSS